MSQYVDQALFIYSDESAPFLPAVEGNAYGVEITGVRFDDFSADPEAHLSLSSHLVVSGKLSSIKSVIHVAMERGLSIGILPLRRQKSLRDCYGLPEKLAEGIGIALRTDAQPMDIIKCNQEILLFKATVGRLPLLDATRDASRWAIFKSVFSKMKGLRLLGFNFEYGDKKLKTAACGCMVVQQHERSLASKIIEHDSSAIDGMVSLVVAAPRSIVDYLRFIGQALRGQFSLKKIPRSIGYIKSRRLDIQTDSPLEVRVDGEKVASTPLQCEVFPGAVRINVGEKLRARLNKATSAKETANIRNLPVQKELEKAKEKYVPFFSYASEERFKDLFLALREDARLDMIYLVLMVLSTGLATVGLYLSSASVVIGAMLLAPLMSPIVSLSMGLLRRDERLSIESLKKTLIGIGIALLTAAVISLLFPHEPVTPEMEARLNPTLLDLAVAILAGIAGAYTKSFKEILQSLAGVAIAVALVPPLSVAGIGLGRLDFAFFSQAFLLFTTNFIGITLAAAFTFRLLGYSAVIRNKRGVAFVAALMLLIAIPLYFSYQQIVEKAVFEKSWRTERFLVNDKYLIVKKAALYHRADREIVYVTLLARDQLNRYDLAEFKRMVQENFDKKLIIRANIAYIP